MKSSGGHPHMRWIAGLLIGVGFVGVMVVVSIRETRVRCEICLDYGGASACRAATGASRDQALQTAISTACAVLARGRTQNIQCLATPPRTVSCDE